MDADKLAVAFVELAETLVGDFDVHDLLHVLARHSRDLLSTGAAGLLLVDEDGRLQLTAASNNSGFLLDFVEVENDDGPCRASYREGRTVVVPSLESCRELWPRFVEVATAQGFHSVLALPMRIRGETIGSLSFFGLPEGLPVDQASLTVAQALADVATIAIVQARVVRSREQLAEQLQTALRTRVVIEQAKGVISSRLGVGPDAAFQLLRSGARRTRRPIVDVADDVVEQRWGGLADL